MTGHMQPQTAKLRTSYGPWGIITGGSEGLGAEFARQLAAAGLNLLLVARRRKLLERFAGELAQRHGVQVQAVCLDMADARDVAALIERAAGLDVGLLVCSAASSPIGPFLGHSWETHERLVELNCKTPARLTWELGRRMSERKRGGIILLSSMASLQGTGCVVHYAASKAYVRVLAEGLWNELHGKGVDVLACCPGIVSTPTFLGDDPRPPRWLASPLMECQPVVTQTLRALGRKPSVVPGSANKLASWFTQRLLPRRMTIALASIGTRAMYRDQQGLS
jgi:short-subunit dehydrogenase